jgi:putative intracellular protease/amidase
MKVLIVLNPDNAFGDQVDESGFGIEEFASPYYFMADKGVELTITSPRGNPLLFNSASISSDLQTPITKRFHEDMGLKSKLGNALKINEVSLEDYDAVYYT